MFQLHYFPTIKIVFFLLYTSYGWFLWFSNTHTHTQLNNNFVGFYCTHFEHKSPKAYMAQVFNSVLNTTISYFKVELQQTVMCNLENSSGELNSLIS